MSDILFRTFHPLVARWFAEAHPGGPTDAQNLAWPRIAAGEHVLVCAPTGSGKTLTAFLFALDSLVRSLNAEREQGLQALTKPSVRVLYVSPLKALNTDVGKNLTRPLKGIAGVFESEGTILPEIRVGVRSGDTDSGERRAMLRHPPHILITTPESLNLMLSTPSGRAVFTGLRTVILDEIHVLAGSKRGAHLISAVERLTVEAGEFQRIGLSATVRPLERVASWMGGFRTAEDGFRKARDVSIVRSADRRDIELRVRSVQPDQVSRPSDVYGLSGAPSRAAPAKAGADGGETRDLWWQALIREIKAAIASESSTLVFCNSRRMAEKIARLINEGESEPIAWSHHGSLSKELRFVVEQRLKAGEIKAIVATGSLELGIDIGSLGRVILVETPFSASQTLQRIGRAGHQVGGISRADLFPLHGLDTVYAAAMAGAVSRNDIEPVRIVDGPLDVLAQVILSTCARDEWPLERLYEVLSGSSCFAGLDRRLFDLTLDMLAGRYADAPVRELKPRIELDLMRGTVRAREGSEWLLYQSGGTIPDRGYFKLRMAGGGPVIGELDEEFVWERVMGDQFSMGTQNWKIMGIGNDDVEVVPADPGKGIIPFWKAEDLDRDFHTATVVGDFLDAADKHMEEAGFAASLRDLGFDDGAVENLLRFLRMQKTFTGTSLPGRKHILIEEIRKDRHGLTTRQIIYHSFWGGRVNKPLAMAIAAVWEREHGSALEFFAGNECFLIELPEEAEAEALLRAVTPENVYSLLRERLEKTGMFGAMFRENAGRALLLPKGDFKKRFPLWLNRLRSKKLLDAVMSYSDFPIVIETWRSCLEDVFDMPALVGILDELQSGAIKISRSSGPEASPFAEHVVWRQTGTFMYQDDTPNAGRVSNLSETLYRQIVENAELRPVLPAEVVKEFTDRLHARAGAYLPQGGDDVSALLRNHLIVAPELWSTWMGTEGIADAWNRDVRSGEDSAEDTVLEERSPPEERATALKQAVAVSFGSGESRRIVHLQILPRLLAGLGLDPDALDLCEPLWTGDPGEWRHVKDWLKQSMAGIRVGAPEGGFGPAELCAEWLRWQGPVAAADIAWTFSWTEAEVLEILETLAARESVVYGRLVADTGDLFVCDISVYESLLRAARRARRPTIGVLPAAELTVFLAERQYLLAGKKGLEGLQDVLDRLIGFPAAAELWETALLPARLRPYYPSWLDSLCQNYGVRWFGTGKEKVSMAMADELDVYLAAVKIGQYEGEGESHNGADGEDATNESDAHPRTGLMTLFRNDPRPRSFAELLSEFNQAKPVSGAELPAPQGDSVSVRLTAELWDLVWQGRIVSDSFDTLRRGILNGFTAEPLRAGGRAGARRWEASRPSGGNWYPASPEFPAGRVQALSDERDEHDLLGESNRGRERARQVLRRYGVVARTLLRNESPGFRWADVFPSLRLMELSGEIVSGYFFEGLSGLQFLDQEALARLRDWHETRPSYDEVWIVNACDPASLCGLGVTGMETLPKRAQGTWLIHQGRVHIATALRDGKELIVHVDPGSAEAVAALGALSFLVTRQVMPRTSVSVEIVNGEPAPASPYAEDAARAGFIRDYRTLSLWKRY